MTNTSRVESRRAPHSTRETGSDGEALARAYLESHGLHIIETNWRCREGEIDIVALEGAELVVVEVKTRRSGKYGRAAWAVTEEKHRRLRRLAGLWAAAHEAHVTSIRVDVIGVEWHGTQPHFDHRKRVRL